MAGTGNRPARERFDFSLDARQVAGVILGSLGAVGLAFFLGHTLGQRVAERPAEVPRAAIPPAPAAKGLEALDPPPSPDGEKYKDTFHDALTRASPPPDRLPATPKAPAPPKAAPVAVPATIAASPAPSGPSGPSGATGPPAPSGPVASTPAKTVTPPAPSAALPRWLAAPATVAAPAAAPATAAAPKASPPPPPLRKGASERGAWVVQVGSTQERFEADRIAARFAGRGARVTVADVPGKGRWYRVRLGSFDTREAADRYLKDLERTTGARGFVASAN